MTGKKRKYGGSSGGVGGGGGGNGFKSLGLSDSVYRGIVGMGFRTPTPVQRKSLPVILSGVDTVVMARTGSGKTCAFLVPLLEKLLSTPVAEGQHGSHVRGLILSPTRELSMQTLRVFQKLTQISHVNSNNDHDNQVVGGADRPLRAIGIHGGEGMEKQFHLLASKPDVIIATPGRLAHHLSEIPDFKLTCCQMCILDEADRLLEMGFAAQIREIARSLPEHSCQKVMLSATMPKILIEFTKSGFAVDPTVVRLDQEATVSDQLRIAFCTCRSLDKDAALLHILHHIQQDLEEFSNGKNNKDKTPSGSARTGLTLIFAATRHHVEYIATLLQASGISTTLIYGSLDQEARKSNLQAFRSGQKPVLVVTDVAARGIDIPLLDHVIHYHFPPSPKLFVHRSGRAARAGRIGYCWGLVEPDELPYMIDLHLFLGRKPCTGIDTDGQPEMTYTLPEMTPDMVHYGSLPESVVTEEVENVQRIMNSELSGSLDAQALRSLTRVCQNSMKQYRRTRTEASREGVRRAKAILEGERLETGQRVGGGAIPTHPLFLGLERKRQELLLGKCDSRKGLNALDNLKKREEFLKAMSNFRPKETVFEAFATGGGKDVGIVSHLDKGRTTKNKKHDSSAALNAMKSMRRQMRMARDKGSSLVVAGSTHALATSEESFGAVDPRPDGDSGDNEECLTAVPASKPNVIAALSQTESAPLHEEGKRRLSKAERRRLKKNPGVALERPATSSLDKSQKAKTGDDFRDAAYYMDNDFTSSTEEAQRARQVEAAMQPSAASAVRGSAGKALRIEEAMLDIVGDENEELVKKQRMMRWDKSKRKYIQTTVGNELSGDSKSKKLRLESGQLVKNDKLKLGELYAKWQKKTNRSVGRTGVFDADGDAVAAPTSAVFGKTKKKKGGKKEVGEKMKTAADIKKDREKQHNMKMKNMKKSDRRHIERKEREGRNAQARKEWNKSAPRRKL